MGARLELRVAGFFAPLPKGNRRMINPRTIENGESEADATSSIFVKPSDNVFTELGNNDYDFKDLISELIDNSLAARIDGERVNIEITLHRDTSDRTRNKLVVWDDASGMSRQSLGAAISPAALQTAGSLNEHGLGMKQAIAGLGQLESLTTRSESDDVGTRIHEFKFGEIPVEDVSEDGRRHGTMIVVRDLKPIVPDRGNIYTRDIVPYLGARYRRFLSETNPAARITLRIVDVDNPNDVSHATPIEPIRPIYYHPNTHRNTPVIEGHSFSGDGWSAELVFGYSPETDFEWRELGIDQPNRYHPYHSSLGKQGLDVILNDRVLMFHQLTELNIVGIRHSDYNYLRGELILKHGFKTAITKNNIIKTDNWDSLVNQVSELLIRGGYIRSRSYPDALPEAALRDRLAHWLGNNDLVRRQSVAKEYVVEALGGKIDILADREVWEMKRDDAYGLDVYQLFAYLDMGDWTKGYLVAKSFRESAARASEHINEKHNVEIRLMALDEFPINHPLTPDEREQYL